MRRIANWLAAQRARRVVFIAGMFPLPFLGLLSAATVVIGLMFFVTMAINTYIGPSLAMSHALVPPAMRALVSAILFFVINLIGLGMGPLCVGLLSDWLSGMYGAADGLRYAMLIVGLVGLSSVVMFALAARHLRTDLAKNIDLG